MNKLLIALSIGLASLFGTACDDGPDTAGEAVEEAGEQIGDAIDDAGDKIEDVVDEVKE